MTTRANVSRHIHLRLLYFFRLSGNAYGLVTEKTATGEGLQASHQRCNEKTVNEGIASHSGFQFAVPPLPGDEHGCPSASGISDVKGQTAMWRLG